MKANMRYFVLLIVVAMSLFTSGQRIDKTFDTPISSDDFSDATSDWPQRYTSSELLVIQGGVYKARNNKKTINVISPSKSGPYEHFQYSCKVNIRPQEGIEGTAGVAFMIEEAKNSAIFIEINNRKHYRIRIRSNNRDNMISGGNGDVGWKKSSKLKKKAPNEIKIRCFDGVVDVYLNGHFVSSFTSIMAKRGDIGLVLGATTEAQFDDINILGLGLWDPDHPVDSSIAYAYPQNTDNYSNISGDEGSDDVLTAMASAFKKTIDAQNEEIKSLKQEVNKLESELNNQTGSPEELKMFEAENQRLREKLAEANTRITALQSENEQLKSVQSLITAESENEDLVLELTRIISKLKKENAALKKQISDKESLNIPNN